MKRKDEQSYSPDTLPKRPNLKLSIKNFGPINDGEIDVRPLTVIIGPNNAGKSYTAMLINSIYNSIGQQLEFARKASEDDLWFIDNQHQIYDKVVALSSDDEILVEKQVKDSLSNLLFTSWFKQDLLREIKGSFLASNELVRKGKRSSLLRMTTDRFTIDIQFDGRELEISGIKAKSYKMKIVKRNEHGRHFIFDWEPDGPSYVTSDYNLGQAEYGYPPRKTFLEDLFHLNKHTLLDSSFLSCFYLPSSRSGLVQIYKVLTSSIYRKLSDLDSTETELPKISKVVSDFLATLTDLTEGEAQYSAIAEQMEKDILKGKLSIDDSSHLPLPNIEYAVGKLHLPLGGASSTVTELGPIILYLKHVINPPAIMIVEEPEAHLHPGNQRLLAQYLVKLIRQGLNIIITTHSDYLLEQLASFVMLSGVDEKTRIKKFHRGKDDFLMPEEVGVYAFKRQKRGNAFKIEPVEVTQETGISMDEFSDVLNELYEETSNIRIDLQEK